MTENVKFLAGALFVVGSTLVVTSMWALGVTGTYLGRVAVLLLIQRNDYFHHINSLTLVHSYSQVTTLVF